MRNASALHRRWFHRRRRGVPPGNFSVSRYSAARSRRRRRRLELSRATPTNGKLFGRSRKFLASLLFVIWLTPNSLQRARSTRKRANASSNVCDYRESVRFHAAPPRVTRGGSLIILNPTERQTAFHRVPLIPRASLSEGSKTNDGRDKNGKGWTRIIDNNEIRRIVGSRSF